MNPDDRLTFARVPSSPGLMATQGVEIAAGNEPSAVGKNFLWLHGRYQISRQQAARIATSPLQKALVITAVSGGINLTKNLVRQAILFEDDETVVNGVATGYFNYDLTDWLNMYERRAYLVTVSLGHFISNTARVDVNPIPVAG